MSYNETTKGGVKMDLTETKHIWNKKPDELTVGESLKISTGVMVGVTAISIIIPVAVLSAIAAFDKISDKFKMRKFAKDMDNTLA